MIQPAARLRFRSFFSSRRVLAVILVLLLWPSLCYFPGKPETSLDASWQQVLIYAHAQHWQFGREIVFTWGPWGFLNSQFQLGDTGATAKLIWETVGTLLLAIGLITLTQRLPTWRQVSFVLGYVLFSWLFLDTVFLVFIALAVVACLLRPAAPRWQLVACVVALAFLAEFKFTYSLIASAGMLAATAAAIARRRLRIAAALAGGFAGAFVILWVAAGQNPKNIWPYFRMSWETSTGYAAAMGVDEQQSVFLCGIGILMLCGIFLWRLWRVHPDRPFALSASAFLAFAWFLVWKHGFIRADGHVHGFFLYTLLLAIVLPAVCFPDRRWHWFDASPALCLLGVWLVDPGLPLRCPKIANARIHENLTTLAHVGSLRAAWVAAYLQASADARLPAIQKAVGNATVDVYNYNQGVALLNHLRYTPRPIFQGYSAYTSLLMEKNLRFCRSSRAPDFLIWKHGTIDSRFPTLDDAALLSELPRGYQPMLEEGDYLLLKKASPLPAQRLERRPLLSQSVAFGEELPIPTNQDHPVWFQATVPLNILGRLRAFFYKPPLVNLTVTDDAGRETTWRLLPRVAEDGFLLEPLIEIQSDFAAYLRGHGDKWLRSLRLEAPPDQKEFWSRPDIRLYTLPELTLSHEPAFLHLVDEGITNVAPVAVKSNGPLNTFPVGPVRALLVHAPGEMTFALPDGINQLTGSFGINDGAYINDCRTDGVDFIVDILDAEGHRKTLLHRYLNPLNEVGDRGPQLFRVALPDQRPATLVLRTLPGPKDDSRWDWSFWANLRFSTQPTP